MLDGKSAIASLERLVGAYLLEPKEAAAWSKSVIETCSRLSGFEFERVCIEAMRSCKFRPAPAQFLTIHRDIDTRLNPNAGGGYVPPTPEESRDWCLLEIDRAYTPEAAHDFLEYLNENPKIARWVTQPVMEALMTKSATADPAILKERARVRNRGKAFQDVLERLPGPTR